MNFIILPSWRLCSRRLAAITLGRDNCSNLKRFIMAFLTENSSGKRNGLSIKENLLTRIQNAHSSTSDPFVLARKEHTAAK